MRVQPLINGLTLSGTSPPSVFVGRIGYPYVSVGPLIPPVHGDTAILDTPEHWLGKSIDDIVRFRAQLVRCKREVRVDQVDTAGKLIDLTRELALAATSINVDAEFSKRPTGRLVLDDAVQPFGPSAPLKSIEFGTIKIDTRLDKVASDEDMKAVDAVVALYERGVLISKIQRAFSVGAFGLKKHRRFVPTRWSITAVDDIIGLKLLTEVKQHAPINEYRVYESWQLDNRFIVLMIPAAWSYELIEAWYPRTIWNPHGGDIVIYSSAERYKGRTTYAEIGGCYYAARLAVAELLARERRQATVVILREAHPGYIMPVGVWNVRENVRNALRAVPHKFDTLHSALQYIATRLAIPLKRWIIYSNILKELLYQTRLDDF
jgi:hypothetical protein